MMEQWFIYEQYIYRLARVKNGPYVRPKWSIPFFQSRLFKNHTDTILFELHIDIQPIQGTTPWDGHFLGH